MFELKDYLMHKEDKKNGITDYIKYFCLAFRPIGNILICLALMAIISVPCVIILSFNPDEAAASSILTGVIASGLVALVIEISNNIRRSKQRLIVLHEYLSAVANYEQFIEWKMMGLRGEYDKKYDFCSSKLTKRLKALALLELEIVPPIDSALDNGRDYLSYKEIELLTQIEEASNDIAKTTNSRINDNINRQYDIYDALKQPFKKKIQDFSDDVGIQIIDKNLESVVFDYYMENFEELSDLEQSLIKYQLHTIDECIKKLRKIVAWEPVYSDDLIPFELRMKKYGIDVKAEDKKIKSVVYSNE